MAAYKCLWQASCNIGWFCCAGKAYVAACMHAWQCKDPEAPQLEANADSCSIRCPAPMSFHNLRFIVLFDAVCGFLLWPAGPSRVGHNNTAGYLSTDNSVCSLYQSAQSPCTATFAVCHVLQFVDGSSRLLVTAERDSTAGWFGKEDTGKPTASRSLRLFMESFVTDKFLPAIYLDFRQASSWRLPS